MWFGTSSGLSSSVKRSVEIFYDARWFALGTCELPLRRFFRNSLDWNVWWSGSFRGRSFSGSRHRGLQILHDPYWASRRTRRLALDRNLKSCVAGAARQACHGALGASDVREYGAADGLLSSEGINRSRSVVADSEGRIWFSLGRGISVVDPSHMPDSSPPAIAHVEAVLADDIPHHGRRIRSAFHLRPRES